MRWLLDRLLAELSLQYPGSNAMSEQIMHMIFIEMIRASVDSNDGVVNWLGALLDPRIGRAMQLIHAEPSRSWRIEELASASNLSRSQFSARFAEILGIAPIEYLLRWRMTLAAKALRRGREALSKIAYETGYNSEAAFGAAFKRVHGISPGRFRELARDQSILSRSGPSSPK